MKTLIAILLAVLAVEVSAQSIWTTPLRITSGNQNDIHPTIGDGNGWLSSVEREMLAFSRDGKNIGILQSALLGASWPDSITWITTDSADNDFPTLVRSRLYLPSVEAMLVWQGRRNNNFEILFSKRDQSGWSSPQAVTTNSVDDQHPHVACHDTTYYAVWEQQGKVLFSQYVQNAWTVPLVVSGANDTLNHVPQVTTLRLNNPPSDLPCVVWQRRKEESQSFALMASFRSDTGWSFPEFLIFEEDNRRPRFFKYGGQATLTWEMRGEFFTTMAGNISVYNGRVGFGVYTTLNGLPDTSLNCSVNGAITGDPLRHLFVPYTAAAWELPRQDSIGVATHAEYNEARVGASGAVINRNPTVSEGTGWIHIGWHLRVWVVWEALVNGIWQLYGSSAEELVAAADEPSALPTHCELLQNYPNPFNPTTTIEYSLPSQGSKFAEGRAGVGSHVTLKVYDVLGREVATLVNETKAPGRYSVVWNAAGVASGVYFYKLETNGRVETKRMLVIK